MSRTPVTRSQEAGRAERFCAVWVESLQLDVERFVRHCNRYRLIWQNNNPHGVFKFRSIKEAQDARALSGQTQNT